MTQDGSLGWMQVLRWVGQRRPMRLTGVKKTELYQNIGLKWDQNPSESISVDFSQQDPFCGPVGEGEFLLAVLR